MRCYDCDRKCDSLYPAPRRVGAITISAYVCRDCRDGTAPQDKPRVQT